MGRAAEWLEAGCRRHGVPEEQIQRLVTSLYEVLANIMTHGGDSALAAPIGLELRVTSDGKGAAADVTVSDSGDPFDPLSVAPRETPQTLEEAKPNGMGMTMIRAFSDFLEYRHEGGRNHLTFGTRWLNAAP
jgi:serine/threonine-protein kinase RsbW